MTRTHLGILFGGVCEEHPISVKSAQEVARHLDTTKYEPHWVGITTDGEWKLCAGPEPDWAETGRTVVLSPDRGVHGLLLIDDRHADRHVETRRLDVVLPVLHGKLGEDGAVQGLLELAGIPYVGCDIQSSALCMDKSLTYLVAASAGVATPRHWVIEPAADIEAGRFPYPVFVKPARSGSSFGVSKVAGRDELADAVSTAREYDSKVIVEEAVVASEIGCAILGDDDGLFAGEVDRIAISHGFFRIHQEETPETGSENSTFVVPADIPDEFRARVQATAKTVYRALGCRGLARVDLFLKQDGSIVLNEVNTLPGLTSYSRYPRMMAAAGLSLGDVIDRIVSLALNGDPR